MEKTHWKKLTNPDYIGAYSLTDKSGNFVDLVVKIESISRQMVTGADGKKDECTVAKLVEQKPFIVNATNSKQLTKLFNSPFIEDWAGKPFTLYVAKIKVAGDTVDALRIRPELPQIKRPEFTPKHEKWGGAINAIKSGTNTVDATIASIRGSYELSAANEKLLKDAAVQN